MAKSHRGKKRSNSESEEEVREDKSPQKSEQGHSNDKNEKRPSATTNNMMISDGKYRNKQRCLMLCSRGTTARYRHLLEDLRTLIPHHKKEPKLDAGSDGIGRAITDIAEMRSCNSVLFLECRKKRDA